MSRTFPFSHLVLLSLLALPGCGMATMIETNTRSIDKTSALLGEASSALADSNRSLHGIQKSIDRLGSLEVPMERVAGLERSMIKLAELKEPMEGVERTAGGMAELKQAMAELKTLGVDMRRIAALKEPMEGVAALDDNMARVAALKEPMQQVAVLQRPLEEVGKLSPPMVQMTQMGNAASQRVDLVIAGLFGWGLMTFLGVYLGVQAGTRRLRAREALKPEASGVPSRRVALAAPEA